MTEKEGMTRSEKLVIGGGVVGLIWWLWRNHRRGKTLSISQSSVSDLSRMRLDSNGLTKGGRRILPPLTKDKVLAGVGPRAYIFVTGGANYASLKQILAWLKEGGHKATVARKKLGTAKEK